VARIGKDETHTGFWLGNLNELDHLQNVGVFGRMILKWVLQP